MRFNDRYSTNWCILWTDGTTRLELLRSNYETNVRYNSYGNCRHILRSIVSIPVALLCASNIVQTKWIAIPARFILNIVRTIPDLLLAAVFVAVFGIGQIPGVLALFILTICIIGKLLYESLETIEPGPMEAMTAVGANKVKWIVFGVVPQAISSFMSYVLFAFEINIRASAVLGLVGAGVLDYFTIKL